MLSKHSKGGIRPSTSPWRSPVDLVPKSNGTLRFCIDYWKVNAETVLDAFPLPHIGDLRKRLRGAQFFSCLDLKAGYWQIPLHEESKSITAFSTIEGHFEFNVLPFGLSTAAAAFQRTMNDLFRGLSFVGVYLDDIIIHSTTLEERYRHLEIVLKIHHQQAEMPIVVQRSGLLGYARNIGRNETDT